LNQYNGSCHVDINWRTYYASPYHAADASEMRDFEQATPICYGIDPDRKLKDAHMGDFNSAVACKAACLDKTYCKVYSYNGNSQACYGFDDYSGKCKASGTWNTYSTSGAWPDHTTGAADSDITEMWGDVDNVHFVHKGACVQVKGKGIKDHKDMKLADVWAKKHHTEVKDGECNHKYWNESVNVNHTHGYTIHTYFHTK